MTSQESTYLSLMDRIIEKGEKRQGRNGVTHSIFGERLVFDLTEGFPLLTTKRVFWRGVVEELLWFLRGSTDVHELQTKGVHIWDGNTSREFLDSVGLHYLPEGSIGAGYGFQWRSFGGAYPEKTDGKDQLAFVLNELVNNPHGRRAILSAWNPQQLALAALPPCHLLYDFYRGCEGLSCQMVMRSCDVAAGLPFNIASTALLLTIIATAIGETPHKVIIVTGDTHLYEEHVPNAKIQIMRKPMQPPSVCISKPLVGQSVEEMVKWIESLTFADFSLSGYQCHGALKYSMVV